MCRVGGGEKSKLGKERGEGKDARIQRKWCHEAVGVPRLYRGPRVTALQIHTCRIVL